MKLFVGLGNPGDKYARNRHNVGCMAVQRIAERHLFGPWKRKFQGHAADGEIAGEKVLLLKPETFMNDSGRAVGEAARFLKIAEADIVVFHDELDLLPSRIKFKVGGGNAGHNGLRSISAHVGNDYQRVRIGIGHPGNKDAVYHFVLSDFAKADAAWLPQLLDAVADAAGRLAANDSARFLTDVARTLDEDAASKSARNPAAPTAPHSPQGAHSPQGERASPPAEAAAPKHPTGERMGKRQSALAENLRRWMKGKMGGEG